MPWETRHNGSHSCIRSRRFNGRAARKFVSAGPPSKHTAAAGDCTDNGRLADVQEPHEFAQLNKDATGLVASCHRWQHRCPL